MPEKKQEEVIRKPLSPAINFLNAGLSGMCATLFVHPSDVIKNRMQMSKSTLSVRETISLIFRKEGIFKFYAGLSAGLLRQATYTTTRLGAYNQLQESYWQHYQMKPTFVTLAMMAASAGSLGAFIGTPADVVLVRMTSDGRLPPEQRRNYKNVLEAFYRIAKEEGMFTLWRGCFATIGRAAIVNISQLTTYSQTKYYITNKFGIPDGIVLHFYASMLASLVTAFNSMPFDIAKTRIQNLTADKVPAIATVMYDVAKNEGIRSLWKGFLPTFCRIGPHTVITFIFNEQIASFYRKYFMD